MELFKQDGHLTDAALAALAAGEDFPELQRLELAEHLSYCDGCLLRYTELLTDQRLLEPSPMCHPGIWQRIRTRTIQLFTSRYATAAAAVAMVVVLWGGGVFGGVVTASQQLSQLPVRMQEQTAQEGSWQDWPQRWNDALHQQFSRLDQHFEIFTGRSDSANMQGGK